MRDIRRVEMAAHSHIMQAAILCRPDQLRIVDRVLTEKRDCIALAHASRGKEVRCMISAAHQLGICQRFSRFRHDQRSAIRRLNGDEPWMKDERHQSTCLAMMLRCTSLVPPKIDQHRP